MKTSEVVFELVLVPYQFQFTGQLPPLDSNHGIEGKTDVSGQSYLTRTHVRVRSAEHLLWVVRAIDNKLWGLAGKSRFVLYNLANEQFYPLFKRDETFGGKVWRLNSELIRFFENELTRDGRKMMKKGGKHLSVRKAPTMDLSMNDVERITNVAEQVRSEPRFPGELGEAKMTIRKDFI